LSPRRKRPLALALVAAHNEEATIARTVKSLAGLKSVTEVVVLADGCTDGTGQEALAAGARVLIAPRRMGKGGAIESALDRGLLADVYLLVDGDVADTASETDALVEEIAAGRLDLAIGRLPPQAGGGFGLVKALSGLAIRGLCGLQPDEPLSGQRAVKREVLEACRPLANGFGLETAMTIDAVRLGFRVGEVPVDMTHRPTGRALRGFLHRARQGADIVRAVVPRALRLR
jgi:glycosyltransferase involved in cell wall biosynthesis